MQPDLWALYPLMLKSRLFEQAIQQIWQDGLISGEMHLGTGEEAIVAGIVSQLENGDAMALDHRGTAAMLMRGIDPISLLREMLGRPDGLCHGMGGHMHLFSKEHLSASSGIVGASGPAAVGFALAAQYLRPGRLAVAFFGDGAINQGMLMEAMNLAAAWKLPVLFVCKNDNWAITTDSSSVSGGPPSNRAEALGLRVFDIDGRDVRTVWNATFKAFQGIRNGEGPAFLHATCVHLKGHFLGLPLMRAIRDPLRELPPIAGPLFRSFLHPNGTHLSERLLGLRGVLSTLWKTARDPRQFAENDPVVRARLELESQPDRLQKMEEATEQEIRQILRSALTEASQERAA